MTSFNSLVRLWDGNSIPAIEITTDDLLMDSESSPLIIETIQYSLEPMYRLKLRGNDDIEIYEMAGSCIISVISEKGNKFLSVEEIERQNRGNEFSSNDFLVLHKSRPLNICEIEYLGFQPTVRVF